MSGITVERLVQLSNPIIIDIRKNSNYDKGHIKGAINIPYYTLLSNHSSYLEKGKIYYLYCNSGGLSGEIMSQLNNLGYNTVNVIGGYECYVNKVR